MESLRLKRKATADKKSSRNTNEELIYLYIYTGSKLAILIKINCEVDFITRREEFEKLAKNLAIQIASSLEISVISVEDIPEPVKEEVHKFESLKDDFEIRFKAIKVFSSVNIKKKFYSISESSTKARFNR